jgi:hypothetical protein
MFVAELTRRKPEEVPDSSLNLDLSDSHFDPRAATSLHGSPAMVLQQRFRNFSFQLSKHISTLS